jgi:hypothetical protein
MERLTGPGFFKPDGEKKSLGHDAERVEIWRNYLKKLREAEAGHLYGTLKD